MKTNTIIDKEIGEAVKNASDKWAAGLDERFNNFLKNDFMTTNIKDESLQDGLNNFRKQYPNVTSADLQTFIIGANWQKEKDNIVIDKLIEALKNIISMNGVGYKDAQQFSNDLQPLIEDAKQLLQSVAQHDKEKD